MSYKNFQVCKEIYLPFDAEEDNGLSLEQYKEKYRIDLRDYLLFSADSDVIALKGGYYKLFTVATTSDKSIIVQPLEILNNAISLYSIKEFDADDGSIKLTLSSFMKWDHTDKTLVRDEY